MADNKSGRWVTIVVLLLVLGGLVFLGFACESMGIKVW